MPFCAQCHYTLLPAHGVCSYCRAAEARAQEHKLDEPTGRGRYNHPPPPWNR